MNSYLLYIKMLWHVTSSWTLQWAPH